MRALVEHLVRLPVAEQRAVVELAGASFARPVRQRDVMLALQGLDPERVWAALQARTAGRHPHVEGR